MQYLYTNTYTTRDNPPDFALHSHVKVFNLAVTFAIPDLQVFAEERFRNALNNHVSAKRAPLKRFTISWVILNILLLRSQTSKSTSPTSAKSTQRPPASIQVFETLSLKQQWLKWRRFWTATAWRNHFLSSWLKFQSFTQTSCVGLRITQADLYRLLHNSFVRSVDQWARRISMFWIRSAEVVGRGSLWSFIEEWRCWFYLWMEVPWEEIHRIQIWFRH